MSRAIVVSMSGGKDSTATALLAITEAATQPGTALRIVFADTGHEHEQTLDYISNYLPQRLGVAIDTVRADFSERIAGKRDYVLNEWPKKGVPAADVERALEVLHPTGVPFLDLCLWKGRFPSRMALFCTQELKRYPLDAYQFALLEQGYQVESWQGIRRDESMNRRNALPEEKMAEGWLVRRPILEWTADRVVSYVRSCGIDLNPLYSQGMGRVGCMPCINVGKDELNQIAKRFPHHVDRVREWEALVSRAAKRGVTTFFTDKLNEGETHAEIFERLRIDKRVEWARTSRGGRQLNMLRDEEQSGCSSIYGLCE
jgi:3'-phosphoadenosine 5'-phosphosulfate sulfotransferase (PAPS reductase)/FAD synthetase